MYKNINILSKGKYISNVKVSNIVILVHNYFLLCIKLKRHMHKDNCKSMDLDTQCIKIIFDISKIKGEEWRYIREFLYAIKVKFVLIQLRFIF